jgi:hypothetical protein
MLLSGEFEAQINSIVRVRNAPSIGVESKVIQ